MKEIVDYYWNTPAEELFRSFAIGSSIYIILYITLSIIMWKLVTRRMKRKSQEWQYEHGMGPWGLAERTMRGNKPDPKPMKPFLFFF